jgi:molybdopterin synthase catalytic subunit
VHARITQEPITPDTVLRAVRSDTDGAVLLFLGTVRRENEGRPVSGLRYDAYVAMAEKVLADIVAEAAALAADGDVAAEHRIGELAIGDVSVAIAVASPHRAAAYAASRYTIEQIKVRLPVWKHEHYADGDARWLDGHWPAPGEARVADD